MLKQYRLKNYHFQLVVYIIALSIIGILLIGSAKHSVQSKQIIGFVMGLTIMIVLSLIDYTFLLKFVWIYYAVMIVLLLLVLFAGMMQRVHSAGLKSQVSDSNRQRLQKLY